MKSVYEKACTEARILNSEYVRVYTEERNRRAYHKCVRLRIFDEPGTLAHCSGPVPLRDDIKMHHSSYWAIALDWP